MRKTVKVDAMFVAQYVGQQADGKLMFLVGKDDHEFNMEDKDHFYTVFFTKDPWKDLGLDVSGSRPGD